MINSKNGYESSVLYIVGTPIGNTADFSPRAVSILQNCNLILAEDTRHSIYLLKKFNINTKLKSYHKFNEVKRAQEIISTLKESHQSIALITDAGMPVISDPGYILVSLALKQGIKVSVVPGPCAVSAAISISGIDCSQYVFHGFLANKAKARYEQLVSIMRDSKASVLYESPHRLIDCVKDIADIENREISVIKEITKQYEHTYYGLAADILQQLMSLDTIKGEYVIIISGGLHQSEDEALDQKILEALKLFKSEGIALKSASKIISQLYNTNKNHVYQLGLE